MLVSQLLIAILAGILGVVALRGLQVPWHWAWLGYPLGGTLGWLIAALAVYLFTRRKAHGTQDRAPSPTKHVSK
nr:GlyGly-CTERM sorting domain-containing protein [uncultured Celeribacter sp.]